MKQKQRDRSMIYFITLGNHQISTEQLVRGPCQNGLNSSGNTQKTNLNHWIDPKDPGMS